MKSSEFYYPSTEGHQNIRAKMWLPDGMRPKAVLQIAHGISEHIGRYEETAEAFAESGIGVMANDHLGHGRSFKKDADRGIFAEENGWIYAIKDIKTLFNMGKERFPDVPYFMLGHSMGSFLMRCWAAEYPGEADGFIFMGTSNMNPMIVQTGKLMCAALNKLAGPRAESRLLYSMFFGSLASKIKPRKTECDWLSRDEERVRDYIEDPLCGFTPTTSLYLDLAVLMEKMGSISTIRRMDRKTPILITSGMCDPVGDMGKAPIKIDGILQKEGFEDVELKLYEGARHELLNETCRETVRHDLSDWMERKSKKQI